jgi:hypothetical protein
MVHHDVDDFQTEASADWAPGLRCRSCGRRHKTWHAVASCRWRKGLSWVQGDPPASGPCVACVSFCRGAHYGHEYVTVTLHATEAEALRRKAGIDSSGCGGSCTKKHRIFMMTPPAALAVGRRPEEAAAEEGGVKPRGVTHR